MTSDEISNLPTPVSASDLSRITHRSCYACHNKKIKCDKKEPCSSCIRSRKICSYPPLGPRVRRRRQTIMNDMASRIASLEKNLAQVGKETPVPYTPVSDSKSSPSPTRAEKRDDVLVQEGSSDQYFNEVIFSRAIEEVREGNSDYVLTPPQLATAFEVPSPFSALGIISAPSVTHRPADFHPPKPLAIKLWNTYINTVEICTGTKLLHTTTDQLKVYSTIENPPFAPLDNLALCFAIYYASLVSLDQAEGQAMTGQNRNAMLLKFKFGLEQSFAHGDVLERPTITGLHALVLYLSALRINNRGKGIWIIGGLASRIARSLGLHRDGERLGLSPFQAEIRRRIYWHIVSRDARAGEDYGFEENSNQPLLASTVKLPLNVDDSDIYPEMTSLPPERKGWTSMSFSLIHIRLSKASQKLATMALSSSPSSPPNEELRAQIVNETRDWIEERIAYCNPVIPQHRLTSHCARFLLAKLDFVTRLQWILLTRTVAITDFANDDNLLQALRIVEPRLFNFDDDDMLTQFAWIKRAYPQYHVTIYVLWHLCVKPIGPHVARAWRAVDAFFADELSDDGPRPFGSKTAVLTALRAKAMAIRQKVQDPEMVSQNSNSSSGPNPGCGQYPATMPEGIDLGFYNTTEDWPEWQTLVQGFQLESPDMYWQ